MPRREIRACSTWSNVAFVEVFETSVRSSCLVPTRSPLMGTECAERKQRDWHAGAAEVNERRTSYDETEPGAGMSIRSAAKRTTSRRYGTVRDMTAPGARRPRSRPPRPRGRSRPRRAPPRSPRHRLAAGRRSRGRSDRVELLTLPGFTARTSPTTRSTASCVCPPTTRSASISAQSCASSRSEIWGSMPGPSSDCGLACTPSTRVPSGSTSRRVAGSCCNHSNHPAWVTIPRVHANDAATSANRGKSDGSCSTSAYCGNGRSPATT